jgi:hypothetical protein
MPDAMTIRTKSFHDRAGRILAALGAVAVDPEDETVWTLDGDKILPCTVALDRAGCNWALANITVEG